MLSRSSFLVSFGDFGSLPLDVVSIVTRRPQSSCQSAAAGHGLPRQSTAKQSCLQIPLVTQVFWSKTQVSPSAVCAAVGLPPNRHRIVYPSKSPPSVQAKAHSSDVQMQGNVRIQYMQDRANAAKKTLSILTPRLQLC